MRPRRLGWTALVMMVMAMPACLDSQTETERGLAAKGALQVEPEAEAVSGESALSASATPACIFGSDSLVIRNRVKVVSNLGSNGTIDVQAGDATDKTTVAGNLAARGQIHIGSNSIVGNINTPSTVNVEPGAQTGTITHNPVPFVTLTTKTVVPGSRDINLNAPSCTGANPAPGNYGSINVNPGCTLKLRAGTYNVANLNVNADAGLTVTGTVALNVKYTFSFGDRAVLTGVQDPMAFQIYSNGNVMIQTHTAFRGTILAPNGVASVSTASSLVGCIRSKQTSIGGTVTQDMCNPPLNSATAVHGNEDWHINTAQEFLDGKDMAGNQIISNFMPASWTKAHRFAPAGSIQNTAKYYEDASLVSTGIDTDPNGGADANQMLYFHAGHGGPTGWDTLGDSADMTLMKLGNCSGGGRLRYFWMCSCETFAHGPKACAWPWDYCRPQDFDGSPDSDTMRNAYQRWANALNHGYLRQACGGSTSMLCWQQEMDAIWDNYNNLHYDVADAFEHGAQVREPQIQPVCLTKGGADVTTTPLYDTTFTNLPNLGGSYFWMQTLSGFQSESAADGVITSYESLTELPVLVVSAPAVATTDPSSFDEDDQFYASKQVVPGRGPALRINKTSGAIYYQGARNVALTALPERQYLEKAFSFITQSGWAEQEAAAPRGTRTLLLRASSAGTPELQVQKNVRVVFKRQIAWNHQLIPVIGLGGEMTVQLNNDGSVLNASKVWRKVKPGAMAALKPFSVAELEARSQLPDPDNSVLESWTWGYREESGSAAQSELRVVLRFQYVPVATTLKAGGVVSPPRAIEIAAQ